MQADLIAVLVAIKDNMPNVLTLDDTDALPAGPLEPEHRSLQSGMRSWVERTTRHPLNHVEQLYTFADRDRDRAEGTKRSISISYLALTRLIPDETGWSSWYRYFPWEDQREENGRRSTARLVELLTEWCGQVPAPLSQARRQRLTINFGLERWDEELVLQRYELLYEAGLVAEAGYPAVTGTGHSMPRDHRRILATGIARLRARIKYRPVFFELMPDSFTLLQLQLTVEALAGVLLHKQNFRRLIESQALIEDTGAITTSGPGRPAKIFRFRREVLAARQVAGSKLPLMRSI
ncbi:hypothetical protein HN018_07885 [Lichenicola cladoniae]|uniref:NrtR DNA-binding winged helix domain-containing protein n=1 Tax=Lichenicola cladoniae TaxID=1484109 RepID=A0A6M8HV79_9PROT|nr:hypothetical protein [Acetobacteraceae bacterium]QKE92514.1 hypothetical protein HN018_07885 [Lichenicola cladoniae]